MTSLNICITWLWSFSMMINTGKSKIYGRLWYVGECSRSQILFFFFFFSNYSFTFLWVFFPSCQSKMHWEQWESYSFMKFIIVLLVVICTSYTQEMVVKVLKSIQLFFFIMYLPVFYIVYFIKTYLQCIKASN